MSAPDTKMLVRNTQRTRWFSIDNELFWDGWATAMGASRVAVYCALAMRADNETQQVEDSYDFLMQFTGLGRTTIHKAVHELERWNIIHIQPQTNRRGEQIWNKYTLLDKSVWNTEAQIPAGKDKATGKPKYITKVAKPYTKKVVDDAEKSLGEEGDSNIGGSLDKPEMEQQMNGEGSDGERDAVQIVDGGGSRNEHIQNYISKTKKRKTTKQHEDGQDGVVETFGSLSSLTEVLSKRQLSVQEEHQFQQHLVLYLMKCVAPDFHAVDGYVRKLTRERTRRAGAALMFIYGNSVKAGTIKNPAGLLRKKIECAEEEFPGLDGLLITWLQLVEHVKVAASQGGRDGQLSFWLVEHNLKDTLMAALQSYGVRPEYRYDDKDAPWM